MLQPDVKGDAEEVCEKQPRAQLIDPLLLAARETPEASTDFSHFELVFGQWPWGLLDIL